MRGVAFSVGILFSTTACSHGVSDGPHTPEFQSAARDTRQLEQLRGEQLAAAIRGRTIVPRRTPFEAPSGEQLYIETPSGEQFRADGTYVRYGDRVQAHGRYEILDDRYCAAIGERRDCSSLYRGRDGQHYLRQVFPVVSGYFPVQLID